jgi:UDP-glucuronate decarboxylase
MNSDAHEPVNLGNPDERSILDIAKGVLALFNGTASRIEFRSLPVDDPKQRCPDLARAKASLGWQPRVGLEDGLGRTIAWFRQRQACVR